MISSVPNFNTRAPKRHCYTHEGGCLRTTAVQVCDGDNSRNIKLQKGVLPSYTQTSAARDPLPGGILSCMYNAANRGTAQQCQPWKLLPKSAPMLATLSIADWNALKNSPWLFA